MSQEYGVKKIQLDEISQTWTESLQSLLKFSHKDLSLSLNTSVNGENWLVNKDEVRGVHQDSCWRECRKRLVVCCGCGCNCKQRVRDC